MIELIISRGLILYAPESYNSSFRSVFLVSLCSVLSFIFCSEFEFVTLFSKLVIQCVSFHSHKSCNNLRSREGE